MKKTMIIMMALLTGTIALKAQDKGEPLPEYNKDTVYIFNSPRSLIDPDDDKSALPYAAGGDLLFSENGFGAGIFIQRSLFRDFFVFASLYISGARNTDEFETWDPYAGEYRVKGKINRVYMFPLTFGVQKNFFSDELDDSFKPYLNCGLGPAFILTTPYSEDFFKAFGYANGYTRFSAFLGAGANFGSNNKTLLGVNVRYYFIPFGKNGIESVMNSPMKDLGGIFISLSVGSRF